MKILFLTESYYPDMSGVPVVVRYLAEGLYSKGHNVSVATKKGTNNLLYEIIGGVNVYRFDIYKDWKHSYKGDTKRYIEFVLNFHADITIFECTQCITTDLVISCLNKLYGVKLFHIHGISGLSADNLKFWSTKSDFKHTIGHYYNWVSSKIYFHITLKRVMPLFKAVMCLSEVDDGIDYVKKYSRKYYILENAADNIFFDVEYYSRDVLSKYTKLENDSFLMSCANYTYIKNQLGIIDQYYRSEFGKQVSLVCIGSKNNKYYYECKKLVEELEIKYGHHDVKLLYGVDRRDIPAIMNKASLYLVGSLWEQYSISIIEAMSQGVPFVSTNVGNARILPGGITVECIEDMHTAIDALLNNNERYNLLSAAGRKFAYENCRIDTAVDKLEKIISEN